MNIQQLEVQMDSAIQSIRQRLQQRRQSRRSAPSAGSRHVGGLTRSSSTIVTDHLQPVPMAPKDAKHNHGHEAVAQSLPASPQLSSAPKHGGSMKRFLMKGGRLFGGGKQAAKEPSASQEMGRWPAANADSRAESRNGRGVPSAVPSEENLAWTAPVSPQLSAKISKTPGIAGSPSPGESRRRRNSARLRELQRLLRAYHEQREAWTSPPASPRAIARGMQSPMESRKGANNEQTSAPTTNPAVLQFSHSELGTGHPLLSSMPQLAISPKMLRKSPTEAVLPGKRVTLDELELALRGSQQPEPLNVWPAAKPVPTKPKRQKQQQVTTAPSFVSSPRTLVGTTTGSSSGTSPAAAAPLPMPPSSVSTAVFSPLSSPQWLPYYFSAPSPPPRPTTNLLQHHQELLLSPLPPPTPVEERQKAQIHSIPPTTKQSKGGKEEGGGKGKKTKAQKNDGDKKTQQQQQKTTMRTGVAMVAVKSEKKRKKAEKEAAEEEKREEQEQKQQHGWPMADENNSSSNGGGQAKLEAAASMAGAQRQQTTHGHNREQDQRDEQQWPPESGVKEKRQQPGMAGAAKMLLLKTKETSIKEEIGHRTTLTATAKTTEGPVSLFTPAGIQQLLFRHRQRRQSATYRSTSPNSRISPGIERNERAQQRGEQFEATSSSVYQRPLLVKPARSEPRLASRSALSRAGSLFGSRSLLLPSSSTTALEHLERLRDRVTETKYVTAVFESRGGIGPVLEDVQTELRHWLGADSRLLAVACEVHWSVPERFRSRQLEIQLKDSLHGALRENNRRILDLNDYNGEEEEEAGGGGEHERRQPNRNWTRSSSSRRAAPASVPFPITLAKSRTEESCTRDAETDSFQGIYRRFYPALLCLQDPATVQAHKGYWTLVNLTDTQRSPLVPRPAQFLYKNVPGQLAKKSVVALNMAVLRLRGDTRDYDAEEEGWEQRAARGDQRARRHMVKESNF